MKKVILTMVVAVLATSGMAQSDCGELLDHNQDGVIGVEDLMNLLSFFGQSLEVDAGPCDNLQSVSFDGYDYDLVAIGDQCWFAENLRTEHYSNGDAIPGELSDNAWSSTSSGAQAVYNNDASNLADYGRLYNWYAVDDARGLCPTGWHVPTDGEYTELTDFLGGSSISGTQMKSSPSDDPSWNGTNTSGFSALAGGLRYSGGSFSHEGSDGDFWSSSPHFVSAWYRRLTNDYPEVYRGDTSQLDGISVRCVRDE